MTGPPFCGGIVVDLAFVRGEYTGGKEAGGCGRGARQRTTARQNSAPDSLTPL